MALFLAGLRSVDPDLVKAAQIDGAGPARIYRKVILPSIAPIFIAVAVVLLQFAIKTFDLVVALTHGGPGIATTFPAIYVYDLMFQRGQIAIGAAGVDDDAGGARGGAGPLRAVDGLAIAAGGPWLTRPSISRSIRTLARRTFAMSAGRIAVYGFLGFFAAHLSLAAVRHRRQFVPRLAGDRAQRPHRAAAKLLAQRVVAGVGALLRRRHLRGHPAQFLQFPDHDDSGDDHLDAARRDQRLRALEMALSRDRRHCSPA